MFGLPIPNISANVLYVIQVIANSHFFELHLAVCQSDQKFSFNVKTDLDVKTWICQESFNLYIVLIQVVNM